MRKMRGRKMQLDSRQTLEKIKEFFNRETRIKYLKLIGVVLCSLLIALSILYLVFDIHHWYIYVFFLIFGCVFLYLFIGYLRRGVKIKKKDKSKIKIIS